MCNVGQIVVAHPFFTIPYSGHSIQGMPAQSAGYSITASPFAVLFFVTLAGAGDGILRAVVPQTFLSLTASNVG
jgi:hypothetical protein